MSLRSLSYIFPAGNTTDVCKSQTLAAAGSLTLNGNLVNQINGTMSFINYGYSRQISLTSTNNLSAVNFVVVGTQNGVYITETITGPNNTTVYGTLIYDTITSITASAAAAAISVGSGWQGFFPLIQINLYPTVINYTLTIATTTGTNNSIAVFGTLDNLVNNGSTYLNSVTNDYNIFTIKALTALPQYVYSNYPGTAAAANPTYSSLIIQLGTAAAAAINVPIKMNFIQI